MTLFPAKISYALSAVFELALRYNAKEPLQIKEIALAHGIPQQFLEQLLVVLKRGGLVTSIRGVNGGYLLARSPEKIRVADVISSLEGGVELCSDDKKSPALEGFWQKTESKFQESFEVTLQDLVFEHGRARQSYVYTI